MDGTRAIFNSFVAFIGVVATWLFGGWDLALKVLVTFIVADYATGVIVAFTNKEIDSKIGFRGILKKSLILIVLIVSVLLDKLLASEWTFRTVVCYFFIGNEGWSILENVGKAGLPLPNKLMDILQQLKQEEGGNISE